MRSISMLSAALCALCACASAPKIDYYTLGMQPSGAVEASVNLEVERLRTTEALGRSQIMILASPTRVEYYATDQWAGSVGETVQQKLATEFGATVDGRRTLVVSGTVLACEQVDGPDGTRARVRIAIVIRDPATPRYQPPLLEKIYESSRSAPAPNPASLVAELSRCVEEIAAEVAADATKL